MCSEQNWQIQGLLHELLTGGHDHLDHLLSTVVVSRVPDRLGLALKSIYLHCQDKVIPACFRLQAL